MTSAQGGPGPGSGPGPGPGQGGQPPYGPPPYGQSPYGQPPYGQPPYGYAPAPWAPAAPPPEPMERPLTVRAGIGAFMAAVVLSAVGTAVSLVNWDLVLDQALAAQGAQLEGSGLDEAQLAELGLRIGIGVGVVVTLLQLLFIWFAWRGHNWARIVLWVIGGFGVASGFAGVLMQSSPLPFLDVLGVFQTLALAVGVVLLALKPSNDWFRHEKWRRAVTGPR